jgi:hypothetical protein
VRRYKPACSANSRKIPGVFGMQNILNGVSMAVGVMEKALYSSYTPIKFPVCYFGRSKKSIVFSVTSLGKNNKTASV